MVNGKRLSASKMEKLTETAMKLMEVRGFRYFVCLLDSMAYLVFYAVMRVRTCYLDLELLLLVSVLCMVLCCLLSSVCGTVLAIVSLTLLNAKRKTLEMGSVF